MGYQFPDHGTVGAQERQRRRNGSPRIVERLRPGLLLVPIQGHGAARMSECCPDPHGGQVVTVDHVMDDLTDSPLVQCARHLERWLGLASNGVLQLICPSRIPSEDRLWRL
jgi:hypothetical protein